MRYTYIIHNVSSANVLIEGYEVVSALINFGSNSNKLNFWLNADTIFIESECIRVKATANAYAICSLINF